MSLTLQKGSSLIKQVYYEDKLIPLIYKKDKLIWSVYPVGSAVFEEESAGSYTFTPLATGAYEISLVGPGSGGTAAGDQPSYASKSRGAGGGSGAYVCGVWNLVAGTPYKIVVGVGAPAGPTTSNNGYSQAAGDSSFGDFLVCGGGGGATAVWKSTHNGGDGGTVKTCVGYNRLISRIAGNKGNSGGGYTYYAGGESVFPPHGAGGYGQATGNYAGKSSAGGNGYCKIRFLVENVVEEINVNFVGNVKFDNGVVSNFTTTNYLMLPEIFNPGDKSWEIVFKFNRTSESGVYESFLGNNGSDYSNGVHVFKKASGELALECCTAGSSSWNICAIIGTTVLDLNKDYWVKAEFTGSSYNLYLSEDGVVYNLEASKDSTTTIGATVVQLIGISKNNTATYFRGSIDLSECYIKSNGEYLWKGITK